MTEFQNKSFSVYPGAIGTQQYRDNYDRIFGKKKDEPAEEPVPDTIPELKSPAEDVYCPDPGYVCRCGVKDCPTTPECFGGSDY